MKSLQDLIYGKQYSLNDGTVSQHGFVATSRKQKYQLKMKSYDENLQFGLARHQCILKELFLAGCHHRQDHPL